MTDSQWDQVYSTKGMAQYPDNALIRFVARNYYDVPNRSEVKFLDVGCGAGSSTWYLAREGFTVIAADGSRVALEKLSNRLSAESLKALMVHANIKWLIAPEGSFDCIVDVSSLCYVPLVDIKPVMKNLHAMLKPGGKIFSIAPTDKCAKEPFELSGSGFTLQARYLLWQEAHELYQDFKDVRVTPYNYVTSGSYGVSLWCIEGTR